MQLLSFDVNYHFLESFSKLLSLHRKLFSKLKRSIHSLFLLFVIGGLLVPNHARNQQVLSEGVNFVLLAYLLLRGIQIPLKAGHQSFVRGGQLFCSAGEGMWGEKIQILLKACNHWPASETPFK